MITIGIDPGKNRVDMVALHDGEYYRHYSFDVDDPRSRADALQQIRMTADWFITRVLRPHPDAQMSIWIEEPVNTAKGRMVAMWLAQTHGALLSLGYLRVNSAENRTWKQTVIGKGNANKALIRTVISAKLPGVEEKFGDRQDLYDAAGIALYGEVVASRLHDRRLLPG